MKRQTSRRPWKALVLALVVGLVFGVGQVGEPVENIMQMARNKLRSHPASGQIVLVGIDDRSVRETGNAPWNGSQLASLVQRVDAGGARRIHLDADFASNGGTPQEAAALEAALAGARAQVLLPARFSINPVSGVRSDHAPPARFARHATVVNTNLFVWWDNAVWEHPYGAPVGGRFRPSLSSVLGGNDQGSDALFPIDYGIDIRSIPVVSASDLLSNRVSARQLAGKDVVIARMDFAVDHYRAPGYRPVPGILFHLVAAETLLAGQPVDLGWAVPLLLALVLGAAILWMGRRTAAAIIGLCLAGSVGGLVLLEAYQVHAEVLPALAAILTAAAARATASLRRSYQSRGTTNMATGMPNLQALRQSEGHGGIVVSARIKNYAHITASLPPQDEKELVEQIVGRLEFGAEGATIYQADEGVFVWLAGDGKEEGIVQQVEGLQALFRSPIVVASRLIDLAITFGLDLDASRSLAQRVSSALVAADEAARDGKRWASFNPASIEDADWAMSLLGRLDHAIDHDELWVAYQPKLECKSGRVIGAEALVRWTHPDKGQLHPDQFIGAAEQGGRIDRLTYFVLDKALEAVASIQHRNPGFTMAVNLSVLLLSNDTLVSTVDAMLRKHRVQPKLLTLEVTETSTLGSAADQIANLQRLSDMGVQLSIDDYGTGFSTLEYLRRIPASEIKIDRSFISMLNNSQSDRIMVNSTIQLAHSLGRKVVAEGVESQEIVDELKRMRCDIVQGYHTGRPVPLDELLKRIGSGETQQAA